MFERIKAILVKEFKQIFRDPRMRSVIFITPLIQIIIFGYAANRDINYVPTAIFDRDNTKESRELLRDFTYSKYFIPKHYISNEAEQSSVLDRGAVNLVIHIDHNFAQKLNSNQDAAIQLAFDGSDSNTAMIVMGYTNTITNNYAYEQLKKQARNLGWNGSIPMVDLRERAWFNGNLISRNYYFPGVICTIVTMMSLLLTAMAIVKEKEIGTMEQLIVSPLKPIELIIGKLLPFAIISLIQIVLITTLGLIWFHIPLRGSVLFLLFSACIYLFTTLGIGLFISTVSATQQEAMMSVFLFFMPTILLSGFAYPITNMPKILQWLTLVNPLRYFMVIIRSIFLKGIGIEVLWTQLWPLLLIGLCVTSISTLKFRKSMV